MSAKLEKENLNLARRVINQTGEIRCLLKSVSELRKEAAGLAEENFRLSQSEGLVNRRKWEDLMRENDNLIASNAEAWEEIEKLRNLVKANKLHHEFGQKGIPE